MIVAAAFFGKNITLKVSYSLLLFLYWLVPFVALVVFMDIYFLRSWLCHHQLRDFHQLFLLTLALGFPHVLTGDLTFVDKEYIHQHRNRLWVALIVVLTLTFAVPVYLGNHASLIIIISYTMYHTMMQQSALTIMAINQKPGKAFIQWKWLSAIIMVAYTLLAYHKGEWLIIDFMFI